MGFFLLIVCPIILFLIFQKNWFVKIDIIINTYTNHAELFQLKLAGYDMNSKEVKELQKKKGQIGVLYSILKYSIACGCIGLLVGIVGGSWLIGFLTAVVFWSPAVICYFKCKQLMKECEELRQYIAERMDESV